MKTYICTYKKFENAYEKYLVDTDDSHIEFRVSKDNYFAFKISETYEKNLLHFNYDNTVSLKRRYYTRLELNKKIIEIIRDNMNPEINLKGLKERYSFKNDLGFDSLDMLNLSVDIEKEFYVCIEDEELEKIKTIKDLKNYLLFLVKD